METGGRPGATATSTSPVTSTAAPVCAASISAAPQASETAAVLSTPRDVAWKPASGLSPQPVESHGLPSGTLQDGTLALPARGVYYAVID